MSKNLDKVDIQLFLEKKQDKYFERLYSRYKDVVYRRLLSLTSDFRDAEDVFQQVWVKVYFSLPSFRQDSSFSTWLFRITTNEAINFLKTRKKYFTLEIPKKISDKRDEKVDIKIDVTNALDLLSKEERTLMTLKYVDGYGYKEISQTTGLKVSACKMRVKRAKEKLQKHLK